MKNNLPHKLGLIECIFKDILPLNINLIEQSPIPSEKELMAKYDIGRTPIREALAWLSINGIISRSSGRGSYLNSMSRWNIFDPIVSNWLSKYNIINDQLLHHMWEARAMNEPYANAMASVRATAKEVIEIEACLAEMKVAADQENREHYSFADSGFHKSVIKASHNLIWEKQSILMEPLLGALLQKSNKKTQSLNDSYKLHQKIFKGIKERDPEYTFSNTIELMELSAKDYFNKEVKCSLKTPHLDFFLL